MRSIEKIWILMFLITSLFTLSNIFNYSNPISEKEEIVLCVDNMNNEIVGSQCIKKTDIYSYHSNYLIFINGLMVFLLMILTLFVFI